ILNVLEGYPLKDLGFRSAQSVHYQIEAMRHAYMDRNSYLGDPDFVQNPLARLLDKGYAQQIRAAIDPAKAGVSRDLKPGVPPHEGSNTTHYSIVDAQGNAVAVTPGGSRIITVVVHTILNVVDYGMNIQEAVDAPRFHQQWLPDVTNVEPFGLSPDTRKILTDMGHKLGDPQPSNHVAAILVG